MTDAERLEWIRKKLAWWQAEIDAGRYESSLQYIVTDIRVCLAWGKVA